MNLIRCIVLMLFLVFKSNSCFTQNKTITYQANNKPLTEILKDIELLYDVHFSYNVALVENVLSSIEVNDLPLDQFLNQLLKSKGLGIEFAKRDFITIKPIKELKITVEGIITDPSTDLPLGYASIQIKGSNKGTFTDEKGYFSMQIENADDAVLQIKYLGYEPFEINAATFYKDDKKPIKLKRKSIYLNGITIREYLNYAITTDKDISRISIRPKDMEILPGLSEADVLHSIQMIPGVYANDESASGINIRGSDAGHGLTYWDRIPVYHQAHYFGMISSLIPSTIEQVDVYRNEIPVRYGNAASGLINIGAWDSVPEKFEAEAGIDLTHADMFLRTPLLSKRSSFIMGARTSYEEVIKSPLIDLLGKKIFEGNKSISADISYEIDDDDIHNDYLKTAATPSGLTTTTKQSNKLRFWDINLKWVLKPWNNNYVSLSYFINKNKLENVIEDTFVKNTMDQKHVVNSTGINAYWEHVFTKKWKQQTSLSLTNYQLNFEYESYRATSKRREQGSEKNNLNNTEATTQFLYNPNYGNEISVGYQLNKIENHSVFNDRSFFSKKINDTINEEIILNTGFINYTNYSLKNWHFNLGARYGMGANTSMITPLLSLDYKLGHDAWLKTSFGIYHQQLRLLKESILENAVASENIWIIANNGKTPLLSNQQFTIGFWKTGKGWVFDFDLYLKKLDGLIWSNQSTILKEEHFLTSGSGTIYGFDLMVRKKFAFYSSWISYTFNIAENDFPAIASYSIPSATDSRHRFRWSHVVKIRAFECSASWTYRTGLPYTKPTDILVKKDKKSKYFILAWDKINNERLPDYHRLDISLWYHFLKSKNKRIKGVMGISVLNLYNQKNVWQRTYSIKNIDGDDYIEAIKNETYLLRFTPNLTVRLTI